MVHFAHQFVVIIQTEAKLGIQPTKVGRFTKEELGFTQEGFNSSNKIGS